MTTIERPSASFKSNARTIHAKIARLRDGAAIRTLDLFAGCGGLSLGFQAAGFEIIGAVEIDAIATRSHARNFYAESERHKHCHPIDITAVEPHDLIKRLVGGRSIGSAVDVIVGGPPCQAFARVGRAKLREVDEHPDAFRLDPRGNLYLRYLQYVRELKPLALLMENVPDVMNYGGHNIAEEVCEVLSEMGYECGYSLLNSSYYGVPQMRERMFLLAYRKELNALVQFPKPTNWVQLPPGYTGSREVALQVLKRNGVSRGQLEVLDGFEEPQHFYIPPPKPRPDLPPAITTEAALRDLPPITSHLEGTLKRGARRFTEYAEYRKDMQPTEYGRLMRNWPGFEGNGGVYDHVIRSLPRDYRIFSRMQPGDQYPQAWRLAQEMCEEIRIATGVVAGSEAHTKLKKAIIPPYDPGKFPNKWRKLEAYLPSRTLMAHIGKDTYSHIHYDSDQARTISVREAARLQSFPDGFVFEGTMNPAFRQIGNAVPPLMAKAIAGAMRAALSR